MLRPVSLHSAGPLPDVSADLVGVVTAEDERLVDPLTGQVVQRVLQHGDVDQGQQGLTTANTQIDRHQVTAGH